MRGIGRTRRHLRRYREIVAILAKHGLGALVDQLGLAPYLKLPKRALRAEGVERRELAIPQRLRMALEELGPTFIKLGQILSTRPDLIPPPYLAELIRSPPSKASLWPRLRWGKCTVRPCRAARKWWSRPNGPGSRMSFA